MPQLGDGRAILLGEIVDTKGVRRDIQLKGSGPTLSRRGDGRAAGAGAARIHRQRGHARAGHSHDTLAGRRADRRRRAARNCPARRRADARGVEPYPVGTFQYFAARQDIDALRLLADHVIARHYPEVSAGDYRALFEAVLARQAKLVARWMLVGFIHGVMNTDNTSIAGETIDYGPCAFMDTYHPNTVFSRSTRWPLRLRQPGPNRRRNLALRRDAVAAVLGQ